MLRKFAIMINYGPQTKLQQGNLLHLSVSHSVRGGGVKLYCCVMENRTAKMVNV